MLEKLIGPEIRELIEREDFATLAGCLNDWLPAELADLVADLGHREQRLNVAATNDFSQDGENGMDRISDWKWCLLAAIPYAALHYVLSWVALFAVFGPDQPKPVPLMAFYSFYWWPSQVIQYTYTDYQKYLRDIGPFVFPLQFLTCGLYGSATALLHRWLSRRRDQGPADV